MATTLFVDQVTLSDDGWFNYVDSIAYPLTAVSGTNSILATGPASFTAYATGQFFRFIPAVTNTAATTINISSIGVKNIFSDGVALVGKELKANVPVAIYYDGTQFNLVGGTNRSWLQDSTIYTLNTVAGTNAITASLTPTLSAYVEGQRFTLKPANTNTGAVTIDINSVGLRDVYSNGVALTSGELTAGVPTTIIYDGTRFQLSGGGSGGAVANNVIYENALVVSSNYTLTTGKNGHSVGPITINGGVTVTIPGGQRWVIT